MRSRLLAASAVLAFALAGCADPPADEGAKLPDEPAGPIELSPGVFLAQLNASFLPRVIDIAVHQGHGLYEPTIDVSQDGVIYVSAHSTGIGVLPAPGYVSMDDGASWQNLALGPVQSPLPGQWASPLLSDEIFIVAGDDGTAWGVDINLHSFIVQGWCGNGAQSCYYNPNAYDHQKTVTQAADCTPVPLKDRPWAAYANGWLLLVNNPGGGPAQIGAMQVPPALPADVGPVASGIQWNLCADSGGGIPGIPDLRDDGFFAVAHQKRDGSYVATTGLVTDVMATQERFVFNNSHSAPSESDSGPSQIGRYGQAVFDGTGALWFGAMNNTRGAEKGGIHVALSTDNGTTFTDRIFRFDQPVSSIYMDGNKNGSGALVNWGQVDGAHTDWYFGHLVVNAAGELELQNVMLAVDDGPEASRHVQGAALGPDGRAYMVMSYVSGNDDAAMAQAVGTTPMQVVVQQDGPLLG